MLERDGSTKFTSPNRVLPVDQQLTQPLRDPETTLKRQTGWRTDNFLTKIGRSITAMSMNGKSRFLIVRYGTTIFQPCTEIHDDDIHDNYRRVLDQGYLKSLDIPVLDESTLCRKQMVPR